MKILHVIEDLGCGGAEYLLLTLLPELKKNGFECHVAVLWPTYELAEPLQKAGIIVHKLNCSHRWNIPSGVFRLCRLLWHQQYDVIHAHLFFSTLYVGLSKFLSSRARRVVTFHNLSYDTYPVNTLWKRIRWYFDRICNKYLIDARVAVSETVKKHYENNLYLSNITVMTNCIRLPDVIDHVAARRCLSQKCNIQPEQLVVLMPGRLVTEKGHRYALEALSLLQKENISPVLVIVGDGPLRDSIRANIQELNLSDQVIMYGAVPQTELYQMMMGADIVMMASTHEGWGLVAAEASGLGKPLLATQVGGVPEIVANGLSGIIVPPADSAALGAALKKLLVDKDFRSRLGVVGRQRVTKNYTVDIIAKKWVTYYTSLLPVSFYPTNTLP